MHNYFRIPTGAGLALALVAGTVPAHAQDDIAALRQQITALQQRLDKLEADAKKKAEAEAKAGPPAAAKFPITISGTLQVQGQSMLSQSAPAANPINAADTLRLRRGELRLTGKITPRVSGTIQIDPAKNLSQNAAGAVNQSSNVLQEITLIYLLHQTKIGSHYLDAGQFKIPVGYEGDLIKSSDLPLINRALMFQARDPFGGGYGDIRETGVRLRGNFNQWAYDLGVFNGLGERQNAPAQTDPKAIIGRLIYRPVPDLALGVSGALGNANTSGAPPVRNDRKVLNAFAAYKRDRWLALAEYLQGDASPLGGAAVRDVRSYYGTLGYAFTPKLEGVARYDYFDLNRDAAGSTLRDITLGLNYYIKGNNAKLQANVVHRNGTGIAAAAGTQPATASGFPFSNDGTALIVQGQVAF